MQLPIHLASAPSLNSSLQYMLGVYWLKASFWKSMSLNRQLSSTWCFQAIKKSFKWNSVLYHIQDFFDRLKGLVQLWFSILLMWVTFKCFCLICLYGFQPINLVILSTYVLDDDSRSRICLASLLSFAYFEYSSRGMFELYFKTNMSLLVQLGCRLLHILKRLLPISVYLLQV